MTQFPEEVWLVWGRSCYYDHAVEVVCLGEDAARIAASNLVEGRSKPRNQYDHPNGIEYWVEHFGQGVS